MNNGHNSSDVIQDSCGHYACFPFRFLAEDYRPIFALFFWFNNALINTGPSQSHVVGEFDHIQDC